MPPQSLATRVVLFASALLGTVPVEAAATNASSPAEIDRKVDGWVRAMTLEEKVDLLGGVDDFYVRGVPRLGIPRFRMADGPMGVRNDGPATAFGGGIALAASWNPELVRRVGVELGRDARAKGVHFLLAPAVNVYRSPLASRNFEYMGEDPFLAARTAVAYIEGVQSQGVSATVKHFMANNSEYDRNNTDSILDERTMREIYMPAFEAAVQKAGVGAVMDSYNLTNGVHMSQSALNVEVLKKEWGFAGVLMSDWFSTYDGVAAANGGLDIEMPYAKAMTRDALLPAIRDGRVAIATIDDKVRRILGTALRFGWLERPGRDLAISRYNPTSREVALDAAREGIVLLKNDGPLLPLDRARTTSILVVGPNAHPAVWGGGGSSRVEPFSAVSLLEGIARKAGPRIEVHYTAGLPSLRATVDATPFWTAPAGGERGLRAEYFANATLGGSPLLTRVEPRVEIGRTARPDYPEGTLSERWTGYYVAEKAGDCDVFVSSEGDGGGFYRLYVDDRLVIDSWSIARALVDFETLTLDAGPHKVVLEHHGRPKWPGVRLELGISRHGERVEAAAQALAAKADVVVVAAGFDPGTESEGADRTFHLPPGQDELIQAMVAANKSVVVVTHSGGAVDMASWIERVPAVLQAWYPGQEGGTAIAEILFGDVNPSGHLPATFERRLEDNPAHAHYYPLPGTLRVAYEEGVFMGYRGFEKNGTKPLFPFGHGLSYTTFKHDNLTVSPATTRDGRVEVSFDVTNTGSRAGAEVAQVYVGETHPRVPRPPKELKGFAKVELQPGETRRVTVTLDRRSLSWFDASTRQWRADPGEFQILEGPSSVDIRLRGRVTLGSGG